MPEVPLTETEMLTLAGSALNKIQRLGQRGATLVFMDETVAMAALIACLMSDRSRRNTLNKEPAV